MTKSIKVSLQYCMVGRTRASNKNKKIDETSNQDLLDDVKSKVDFHFGNRPVFVVNENRLVNAIERYPDCYAVGWFVSDDFSTELVVIDHGGSFESARKSLMYSMGSVDWQKLSKHTGVSHEVLQAKSQC